jgi:phospholipid/cholesterol/gamma-HCH transport system substrate-binding protein
MKIKLTKEARVGLVMVAAILFFYFGFNYLKGKNVFSPSRTFYAVFDDVDQLMPSARVQLNGMQVGIIDNIYFESDHSFRMIVKILVTNSNVSIPKDTEAHIVSDLLGTRTLDLTLGKSKTFAVKGDTLISVRDTGITDEIKNAILPLKKQIEKLANSVDTVLVGLNAVFNTKTQNGLVNSFESINTSLLTFEHTVKEFDLLVTNERKKMGDIFTNVHSITENLKNNNDKISGVFNNLERITDDVAKSNVKQTMSDLSSAVNSFNSILNKIEKGEGSIGQLTTNDSLYKNLDASSRNLSLLLEDMKANPKRYVHFSLFGKKEKTNKQ